MAVDLDVKIADMDFDLPPWGARMQSRIRNTLQRHGIMTLGQLMRTDRDDLPPGLSVVSKMIIDRKLEAIDLKLPSRRGI
jgi:hypothetical protein